MEIYHRPHRIFWNIVKHIHSIYIRLEFFSDILFMRLPCQHGILVREMSKLMSKNRSKI